MHWISIGLLLRCRLVHAISKKVEVVATLKSVAYYLNRRMISRANNMGSIYNFELMSLNFFSREHFFQQVCDIMMLVLLSAGIIVLFFTLHFCEVLIQFEIFLAYPMNKRSKQKLMESQTVYIYSNCWWTFHSTLNSAEFFLPSSCKPGAWLHLWDGRNLY